MISSNEVSAVKPSARAPGRCQVVRPAGHHALIGFSRTLPTQRVHVCQRLARVTASKPL